MSKQITFIEAFIEAIQHASHYNQNDQVPPAVVLWPDKDRQWEALLPLLRERVPQLLTLGAYNPNEWTGPAYWLRCVIARTLPGHLLPSGVIPIIYMPGISKHDIRAIEETPKILQPLAELQYRGVLWTHRNGRDWTISGFLQAKDHGLGIDVSNDNTTRGALQRALLKLADEPLERMRKEAPLRAPFFDALLNPDEVRNILLWLNDPSGYPKRCTAAEWASFCDLCQRKYGFHPVKDGLSTAMLLFGQQQEAWNIVWNRFKEAPHAYPQLPDHLRNARPQQLAYFDLSESWPQDNEMAETTLRRSLLGFRDLLAPEVRARMNDLEKEHAIRRTWVWALLGRSPLATALYYLTVLAKETEHLLSGTSVQEISKAYTEWGWKADASVLDALAAVDQAEDVAAIKTAIAVLYRPWLENAANALQKVVYADHSAQEYQIATPPEAEDGTCILFSDGLRYDVGQRLIEALQAQSLDCKSVAHLVPLPSVTPTAKPAIAPVAHLLSGKNSPGLEPIITKGGAKITAEGLRKLLNQVGYQTLKGEELGDPSSRAWTEMGSIDSNGHQNGWRLTYLLKEEIKVLERRIETLLKWGWKQVIVVTDHGWLLLPDTLPKAELPEHLTTLRKGRCAQIKETANPDQKTLPWYWHSEMRIALAPGICCYEAGKEYEHGGLSPQECIVPIITVTRHNGASTQPIAIENITWRGLRCTLKVSGTTPAMMIDIRTKAGDETTTLTLTPKRPNADNTVSVLVRDEDRMGEAALIVVVDSDGTIRAQTLTTIGG